VVVRAGTRLTWTEEGLEIESTHNDPGVIISLPKGHSSWFGLRAIYRSDCDGYAQFYSRTAEEKTFSGKSQILYAIKKGWNFLALPIQRDEYVESVRFDPLDRPGRMLLQEFVLYTL
uniref:hypothetical protein n=1 Tax=Shinella sp. TaxID=1870904 RepID=UPI003F709ECE